MKTYEYKILRERLDETDDEFLSRINDAAKDGFRFLSESYSDSIKNGCVLMEKELTC